MNNKGLKGDIMAEKDNVVKFDKPIEEKGKENLKEDKKTIVGLDEILNKCFEYINKEIKQEDLVKWVMDNIKVKSYLPIETKFLLVNDILYGDGFTHIEDNTLQSIELETKKFWIIALSYTNISTDGYEDLISYDTYDVLFSVIGDWLLSIIKFDYDRTIEILNNSIGINNLNNILQTFGNLDIENLNKRTSEIKKQIKYFKDNKEQFKDLIDILKFNQPSLDKKLSKI